MSIEQILENDNPIGNNNFAKDLTKSVKYLKTLDNEFKSKINY